MAHIIKDRVLETSTTTGTGALTLAGAVTGYRAFSAVCTSPSDTCHYYIEGVDGNNLPTGEWETGLGTYSAANTLTRTTPNDGSAATPVSFSAGTKRVSIAPIALAASSFGAGVRLNKTADQTANLTGGVEVTWSGVDYEDDAGLWDVGTPARIVVPAGYNGKRGNVHVNIRIDNSTADTYKILTLQQKTSGDVLLFLSGCQNETGSGSAQYLSAMLLGVPLTTGDYFVATVTEESDTSSTIKGNVATHFTLQLAR